MHLTHPQETQAPSPSPPSSPEAPRRRAVLLVDDEEQDLGALQSALDSGDYRVLTANGGAEGLALLAREPVDVIVTDQRMPTMSGVEFLARARALRPDAIRIVLSGFADLQSVIDAVNEGAIYKFLTKPWNDAQLRGHVREALHAKEMSDENRELNLRLRDANRELGMVNAQLNELLGYQAARAERDSTSLAVAREVIQCIPAPVVGVDDDGLIVLANDRAVALLGEGKPLLGSEAHEALPVILHSMMDAQSGVASSVDLGGERHVAYCRPMGDRSASRGRMIVCLPAADRAEAP